MDLDRYVGQLRAQLGAAAGAGDEATRATAERLGAALDAAARLVLLEALSDAAGEITRDLAPGSVDVRLRGRDAELVVTRSTAPEFAPPAAETPPPVAEEQERADDGATTRTTLRLPDQLKGRVEQAAAEEGVSVNTWLVRAVSTAIDPRSRRAARREDRVGDRFTGWVR